MNSRRRIGQASGRRFIDSVSQPRMHGNGLRRRLALVLVINKGDVCCAYLSEADFFDPNWKATYWGPNFDRLAAIKKRCDPEGLFFTHHGVGSDEWSADGFMRLRA